MDSPRNAAPQRDPRTVHLDQQGPVERARAGKNHRVAGVDPDLLEIPSQSPSPIDLQDTSRFPTVQLIQCHVHSSRPSRRRGYCELFATKA